MEIDEKLFESGERGKSLRVYMVNPAYENPWRTQGDYEQEQKEARERHAMLQEQHRLLLRSMRANIVLAIATVGLVLVTTWLVFVTKEQNQAATPPVKVETSKETQVQSQE